MTPPITHCLSSPPLPSAHYPHHPLANITTTTVCTQPPPPTVHHYPLSTITTTIRTPPPVYWFVYASGEIFEH
ncbi:hypothetical protein QVD17_03940 [Tagetes erecta]|uniref:Uncharacterized protein n=1 Tax=Tagetes erecta TaxID=13708 RepID=A0AAD8PAC8_TARER|nr:hypothetical protein QVD17_03940 [Tagetes erecta]